MLKLTRFLALISSAALIAAAVLAAGGGLASATGQPLVPQPSEWVAFTADYAHVNAAYQDSRVGRFYRGDDGSTRSESGPSKSEVTAIMIKNFYLAKFYRWTPQTGWTEQPMDVPQTPWQAKFTVGMTKGDPIEGFDIIRQVSGNRTIHRAPDLNLFVLINQEPCQWSRTVQCGSRYTNIKLGSQPQSLFSPPAGVPIEMQTKPGGIVYKPPV
ncbi:hypothetical protein [Luteitalea sp.]|uniref:hypothetical protein n=1 Tax=Luteitalea sp. TaxID=2004800 RepID=UPI0025BE0055|nr:hypothetical protein [Luteitalea sp.]